MTHATNPHEDKPSPPQTPAGPRQMPATATIAVNENTMIDDLVAKLSDFADLKVAKTRFDELYEQRRHQQREKVQHDAEQIECTLIANGHDKPKRRGRKPKDHDA